MSDSDRLPVRLNQRQWRFCHEYLFGGYAGCAGRAYAIAYKGTTVADATCYVNACRLLKRPDIIREIELLQSELRQAEALTPERHMAKLRALKDRAVAEGNLRAAIKAEELCGKLAGFYRDRRVHLEEVIPEAEAVDMLRGLLAEFPALADRLGVKFEGGEPPNATAMVCG